jgi:hypothetical protein
MEHRKAERRTLGSQRNVVAISRTGTVCGWHGCVVEEVKVLNSVMGFEERLCVDSCADLKV